MNEFLRALSLRHLEKGLPDVYEQVRIRRLTYEAFLRRVLTMEVEGRTLAAQQKRLKAATLPNTIIVFDDLPRLTGRDDLSQRLIELA